LEMGHAGFHSTDAQTWKWGYFSGQGTYIFAFYILLDTHSEYYLKNIPCTLFLINKYFRFHAFQLLLRLKKFEQTNCQSTEHFSEFQYLPQLFWWSQMIVNVPFRCAKTLFVAHTKFPLANLVILVLALYIRHIWPYSPKGIFCMTQIMPSDI